jgi:ferredoxin-NADP reductase
MAKYNYDTNALKGLSVGPFLKEVKTREAEIAKASSELPDPVYNANIVARKLHPAAQFAKIKEVIEQGDAKTYILEPNRDKGCAELAYFRAGQYIVVSLDIGRAKLNKPYTLSSGPADAKGASGNAYAITIKKTANGYASDHILANWKVGTELTVSAPLGDFYYVGLRDAKKVVALAGGSGITPFLSMARAIADGLEDFDLTILYGSRTRANILLKDELDACAAAAKGKVTVVHVLSDDKAEGYEQGFIDANLIKKYAPSSDYSVFVCGPQAMYKFVEGEIAKLDLPKRRVRFEVSGEYGNPTEDSGYPVGKAGQEVKVTVFVRGDKYETTCKSEQTLLNAMETAGIRVPSDCRSGQCGWCHSRLISGDVYVPEKADGRRLADKKFGWIHPCASYPLSPVEIEVFPLLE